MRLRIMKSLEIIYPRGSKAVKMVEKAVGVVQDLVDEITDTGVGFMFTVPIGKIYQMKPEK